MCLIECNQPVYPLDIVRTMRDQRAMMIQTPVSTALYVLVCILNMMIFVTITYAKPYFYILIPYQEPVTRSIGVGEYCL